jgi:tRNA pseudouridine38-40 synthase
MKRRYFLELSYFGKNYHGWQRQPGAVSIQQVMEERLSILLKQNTELTVAGRTDAGVHARQTFAHFDGPADLDLSWLKKRLNSFLPKDIAVKNVYEMQPGAHARFDAIARTYEYVIITEKDPFMWDFAWELFEKPVL